MTTASFQRHDRPSGHGAEARTRAAGRRAGIGWTGTGRCGPGSRDRTLCRRPRGCGFRGGRLGTHGRTGRGRVAFCRTGSGGPARRRPGYGSADSGRPGHRPAWRPGPASRRPGHGRPARRPSLDRAASGGARDGRSAAGRAARGELPPGHAAGSGPETAWHQAPGAAPQPGTPGGNQPPPQGPYYAPPRGGPVPPRRGRRTALIAAAIAAAFLIGGGGGFAIGHATAGHGAGQHQFRGPHLGYGHNFPGGRLGTQNSDGGSNT